MGCSTPCRRIGTHASYRCSLSTNWVWITSATARPSAVVTRVCHTIVRAPRWMGVVSPRTLLPTDAGAKYGDGVDWERADPADYTHLVWVCGPMTRGPRQTALRERFRGCRTVAVDVSLLDELGGWNPYDAVVERDSATTARPDISFLAGGDLPPVVGLCVIERQREYGERGEHAAAVEALRRLVDSRPMAVVEIDSRIKPRRPGRRTPGEVEALLGRMDVVLTNRLHGLVLALKHARRSTSRCDIADGTALFVVDAERTKAGGKATIERTDLWPDQTREALPNDKTAWEAISGGQDILTVGRFEMPSRAYLGRFNFKGSDQQKNVGQLSGGERGRLHLAATLLRGGNVLLLDEPSNDLDVETLRSLEEALLEFAGSVLVISHDRWFLDRIATHILAAEDDSQWSFFVGNY